tara:strand:- start:2832 stop:3041 length:210 start_codon:yes stop_codon:yes gene_type:complete
MSRQYNPAVSAYNNMDIENLPSVKEKDTSGLLARKSNDMDKSMDYSSPSIRVAKQLEVIRRHRNEIDVA